MNRERVFEIIRKEFRQVMREPRMRMTMVIPPIMQFLIFGFVANLDVERSKLAWFDEDNTTESRELRASFEGSRYFTLTETPHSQAEVQDLMDHSRVHIVITVPTGFGADLQRARQTQVQILVDGTDSNTASILAGYAGEVIGTFSAGRLIAVQNQKRMAGGGALARIEAPSVNLEQRVWFNPELKSRNYFIPGILANILTLITLMLTAMAIVREREIGTMEQLMVTPIRPIELMLGKTLPFAIVGLLDFGMIIVLAKLVFHMPFRGNLVFLFGAAILFLFTTLGIGIFISTISRTQQQAIMSTFFFFQPAFMLSGFAFPIRNMPEPVQYLTLLNPIRYFIEICRGVFLKGNGMEVLWPQMLALAGFGIAILFFSANRFHKRLD